MHNKIVDLSDCTEFSQTVQARPPRFVHASVILLLALIISLVAWSVLTEADLVVVADGRVRPMVDLQRIAEAVDEESIVASQANGSVTQVHVRQGERVNKGQVLVRLNTQSLDNDIARQQKIITAAESELARLDRLQQLQASELQAARSQSAAELTQATDEIERLQRKRAVDVQSAQAALNQARDVHARAKKLIASGAITQAELVDLATALRQAETGLEAARLPIDEGKPRIIRQQLALLEKQHATKVEELHIRRQSCRKDMEAAQLELANLQLEREKMVVHARADGIVTSVDVQVGSVVQAGAPLVSITQQRGFRIDVAVASDDVGNLKVGMPARIKLDAFDYQQYGTLAGTVVFISPDTQVDEAANNQAGAFYTVKIELAGDELVRGDRQGNVKLGMTGRAEIVTEQESLFWLFFRGMRGTFSLG